MAILQGFTPTRMIQRQNTYDWIKSRKNHGQKLLEQMKDIELARQIFKAWDPEDKGFLTKKEMADNLISLGLGMDSKFVDRFL